MRGPTNTPCDQSHGLNVLLGPRFLLVVQSAARLCRAFGASMVLISSLMPSEALAAPPKSTAHKVIVTGQAIISEGDTMVSARRRALADALFNAGLAGGSEVRGHTAVSQSRITSHLTIARMMAQVHAPQILSQRIDGDILTLRLSAELRPHAQYDICQHPQRRTLAAAPTQLDVSPHAPPWALAVAQQIAADLRKHAAQHPNTTSVLSQASATDSRPPNIPGFNYQQLMAGTPAPNLTTATRLDHSLKLYPIAGQKLALEITLRAQGFESPALEQRFYTTAPLGPGGLLGRIAGSILPALPLKSRQRLTKGLGTALDNLLTRQACMPKMARLMWRSDRLHVALGAADGLARHAIALTDSPNDSPHMLEISALNDHSATLRPLDPTLSPQSLAGHHIRFIEAGGWR